MFVLLCVVLFCFCFVCLSDVLFVVVVLEGLLYFVLFLFCFDGSFVDMVVVVGGGGCNGHCLLVLALDLVLTGGWGSYFSSR